jgi:hypothetical protein
VYFNDNWKFHKGEVDGAHMPDFPDENWQCLNVPHDWSIEGPFDPSLASATGYLPGGTGWYRKSFNVSESDSDKRIFVHFDGIYCNSDVWINGVNLGSRPNGFISFRYDMTPHIRYGEINTLAVKVNHEKFADCRWYTGSGINRNVHLNITHPVHIKQWGVFIKSSDVDSESANVQMEVMFENSSDEQCILQVDCILKDPSGAVSGRYKEEISLLAGEEKAILPQISVVHPRLWSVDDPALYLLDTSVNMDGTMIDRDETHFGIRTIQFDPDRGFFLNGKNLKLKGVCVHDDAGALGTAVPGKVWERRLRVLQEAGVNAIRMAHNPHMTELYDLCDRMGFLVQDEAFDEWEMGKRKWIAGWNVGDAGTDGYHEHFEQWAEADIRDMILRDRNHPCIIMWSIGNEIDYPNDPYSHEILDKGSNPQIYGHGFHPEYPHSNRLGEIARKLVGVVKRYDTTRPVTAALASALISNETGFADALDVVGYNYQEYRYQEDHEKYPARPLYGSENGMKWAFWDAVDSNPYISGQFLWTGIDYIGEAGKWPHRSNGAGLLDLSGLPKPEYYFRQSIWTDKPMLYIGASAIPRENEPDSLWSHTKAEPVWRGTEGEMVRVICFTNCAEAELFVNGKTCGLKKMSDSINHMLWWDVPYEDGLLHAKGFWGDKAICTSELKTHGKPKRIQTKMDCDLLSADEMDIAHVEVNVVDDAGALVYDANNEISWSVQGAIQILGIENGDHACHDNYRSQKRCVYHGKQLGYIQAGKTNGEATITLTSPGLEGASLHLKIISVKRT